MNDLVGVYSSSVQTGLKDKNTQGHKLKERDQEKPHYPDQVGEGPRRVMDSWEVHPGSGPLGPRHRPDLPIRRS